MKVLDQVEAILKVSHKARDEDKELQIIYMLKFGLDLTPKQIELFHKMPSLETIRRSRQLLQEQGKYLASPKAEKDRYEKFVAMRHRGTEDPEEILEKRGYKVLPWNGG